MRRLASFLSLATAATLVALVLGGCGIRKLTQPDSTPNTTIFIQGVVDTAGVNHIVHLHWYGTDPHGYIVGYEVRLLNPSAPADTSWQFTTRTDSLVTVYTPDGRTSAVFEARAINDKGVRDPDPARQLFNFRNQPPVVRLVSRPNAGDRSDTTFASATVRWTVTDVDGDASKVVCQIWLDGNAGSPDPAPGTSFTVPSARFLQGGQYRSGRRTLYIRAVDDGGMAGSIDSVSWYVRAPVTGARARLLLIDDVPTTAAAKFRVDTLYVNAIANARAMGGVQNGEWSVLHLQSNQPFRSPKDLEQTFEQFETVIWYRGEQATQPTVLTTYGSGIGPYLDSGGKMFLETLEMVASWSSNGAFTTDFTSRYLDSDGVFVYAQPPDSSASWGLAQRDSVVLRCPLLGDSLLNLRNISGLRAFKIRDDSQVLIVAPAHRLTQNNPYDFAVALDVPQAGGGRFIVTTYPMVSATISTPAFPQRASLVLLKILGRLGLTGP